MGTRMGCRTRMGRRTRMRGWTRLAALARAVVAVGCGWVGGCQVPLLDEPPYLVSVNGVDAGGGKHGRQANTQQNVPVSLPPPTSDVVELTVVAEDLEGDPFEIWFPANLGTVEFDPHGTRGRWILPGPDPQGRTPPLPPLNLVLRQPDDPAAATWYTLWFDGAADSGADTGSGGSTPED